MQHNKQCYHSGLTCVVNIAIPLPMKAREMWFNCIFKKQLGESLCRVCGMGQEDKVIFDMHLSDDNLV